MNHSLSNHSHDFHTNIKSYFLNLQNKSFNFDALERLIGSLLWEAEGFRILRMKGLISITNSDHMFELQSMDDIFEIKLTNLKKAEANFEGSKILIVGETIDKEVLIRRLEDCM